jgi:hypothetical protein
MLKIGKPIYEPNPGAKSRFSISIVSDEERVGLLLELKFDFGLKLRHVVYALRGWRLTTKLPTDMLRY